MRRFPFLIPVPHSRSSFPFTYHFALCVCVFAVRYSSASRILSSIPNHVQSVHRTYPTNASTSECEPASLNVCAQKDKLQSSSLLWDGWGDADELRHKTEHHYDSSDEDDLDLSNMGL